MQEKIDGSLCIVYWYAHTWQVATSGTPDASGPVRAGTDLTFADLFWTTARAQGMELPPAARPYTWLFELTGPLNRIVVRHELPRLTLIGCRETATGIEIPVQAAADAAGIGGVPVVREFPLRTLAELQASLTFSPLAQEGYVVVSYLPGGPPPGGQYPRVKVKHPGYVALHHMRGRFTARGLVEVVRASECAEVLAAFPELTELAVLSARYDALCATLAADWAGLQLAGYATRKEFAAAALRTTCPPAMFAWYDGTPADPRAFLGRQLSLERVMALLGAPVSAPALATVEE